MEYVEACLSQSSVVKIVLTLKSEEEMCLSPTGTRTHSNISVDLMVQYLNGRQLKLSTIIIQAVIILQHDIGSLPMQATYK